MLLSSLSLFKNRNIFACAKIFCNAGRLFLEYKKTRPITPYVIFLKRTKTAEDIVSKISGNNEYDVYNDLEIRDYAQATLFRNLAGESSCLNQAHYDMPLDIMGYVC